MANLPLVASFPLVKEHLLHKDSTLSPTLLNSLTCKESQTLTCDSTPPVTTMPKMHPLPRPCGPTSPSCPQDPVFCSPSETDQSMTPPPSPPLPPPPFPLISLPPPPPPLSLPPSLPPPLSLPPSLPPPPLSLPPSPPPPPLPPPPLPLFPPLSLPPPPPPLPLPLPSPPPPPPPRCEWKTQLVTSRSTSPPALPCPMASPPGLEHSNMSPSSSSWYKAAARTWCHSKWSQDETLQEDLHFSFQEASLWTDPGYRQLEAGEPPFIKPDVQKILELQISKRVELKLWKEQGRESFDHALSCVGDMLQSWSSEQAITCKSEQLSGLHQLFSPRVFWNKSQKDCRQLYWGLPFLHSESLMATVSMVGSPLDSPAIFFNELSPYNLRQAERNAAPLLFSPKPLLQHLVPSNPLTTNVPYPRSPPGSGVKTLSPDLTSLPSLQPNPPPTRDSRASCPIDSKSQLIFPVAVQHLDQHLLKKNQESRSDLPSVVKMSQEVSHQLISTSLASQGQDSVLHLLKDFTDPQLKQHLEQHLKTRFWKHEDQKIQLSTYLMKSEDKLPGMGHAEDNRGTSCSSALAGKSSPHAQRVSAKGPEILQTGKDPCCDLTNGPGRPLRDTDGITEGSLGTVLDSIAVTEVENSVRQPRSNSAGPQPGGPGEQQLQDTLRNHFSEHSHDNDSMVPVGTCPGIPGDHMVVRRENSETHLDNSEIEKPETNIKTEKQMSLNDGSNFKDTSPGLPLLDPDVQQVLETHLSRRLVRHRWILPLRGLRALQLFKVNKAVALSLPQPPSPSQTSLKSRDDSVTKIAAVLGDPFQKGSEGDLKRKTVFQSQTPPSALNLEFPSGTRPSDKLCPSESPSNVQKSRVASLYRTRSLVVRDRHSDTVLGPRNDNPVPGPNLLKSDHASQESEGADLDLSHGLSVQGTIVDACPTTSRDKRELEEEGSCDWALNAEAREVSPTQSKEHLKGIESLKVNEKQSPSRAISKEPEDSVTAVFLQDCSTGMIFQDCGPEVLLEADLLASQASQSGFRTRSTTSKTSSRDMYPYFSRGGNVPKNIKSEEPWTSHIYDLTKYKEGFRGPRQDRHLSQTRPAQACWSDTRENNSSPLPEKKIGDRIKSFMTHIMSSKSKVQENFLHKHKASSVTSLSQGSVMRRVFLPPQVAEAQDFTISVRPILQEKVGVGHARTASKKSLHKDPPQAPMGRHVCLHRTATAERHETQGNTPKVHSQPSTDKWMDYTCQAQLLRESVIRTQACQHRLQPPCFSGTPVYSPWHCLCRSELSRKAKAFLHLSG
ncbi:spermatogenesis-associated protein 31A3-like [Rattus norvegicus]|uniref:spermatogenesis-associated protein 31A3-like n=1 Tax=Rattus norvegicus TaxID=10116 RepID=UPI002FD7B8E6